MFVVFYDDLGGQTKCYLLDPTQGNCGVQIPPGQWHTVEVIEPSAILDVKDAPSNPKRSFTDKRMGIALHAEDVWVRGRLYQAGACRGLGCSDGIRCYSFERGLGAVVGVENVVALESDTSAIHLALILYGVNPGDEAIVQSMTSCASTNLIAYLGAARMFVDSERDLWNLVLDLLEEAIKDRIARTSKKSEVIIPVVLYVYAISARTNP